MSYSKTTLSLQKFIIKQQHIITDELEILLDKKYETYNFCGIQAPYYDTKTYSALFNQRLGQSAILTKLLYFEDIESKILELIADIKEALKDDCNTWASRNFLIGQEQLLYRLLTGHDAKYNKDESK